MKTFLTLFFATLCAATSYGQTLKSLMYNTTNGQVVYSGTNILLFPTTVIVEQLSAQNGISVGTEAITFASTNGAATTRTNLGLGLPALTNTNVTNFRTAIGLGATSDVIVGSIETQRLDIQSGTNLYILLDDGIADFNVAASFNHPDGILFTTNTGAAATRTNLGLGWSALTNTNAATTLLGYTTNGNVVYAGTNTLTFTNTSGVRVNNLSAESGLFLFDLATVTSDGEMFFSTISFVNTTNAAETRTNLGLGGSNIVTFAGLTNNGDITINSTTASNGLLYIRRTNNEPFLGLANLIASNNTTISNETLFRVGTAEATNKAAQFGFRSTNTNGNGVAVFSVFGFDALMMIGADASTNAVIYSGGGTNNEVMTLIRDGATEFARPIRFSTNASTRADTNAPANTTNVAAWVEIRIGTNSYRAPLYQ